MTWGAGVRLAGAVSDTTAANAPLRPSRRTMLRAGGLAGIGGLLTTRPAPAPAAPAAGAAVSDPAADNIVTVDATGLPADAALHYRFTVAAGAHAGQSITGRTRTAPAAGAPSDRLVIGQTSCANRESGYFAAYRDRAADEDIDVIMCVGDYIAECGAGEYAGKPGPLREQRPAHEIRTLADYRLRYGTYRRDPDLRAAHAAKPWIVTWDDHEVANGSWAGGAENHDAAEGDWAARRDAAMRAYLEWLPVRATAPAAGGHLYRTLPWGDLAELVMLDLRGYRDRPRSSAPSAESTPPGAPCWAPRSSVSSPTGGAVPPPGGTASAIR